MDCKGYCNNSLMTSLMHLSTKCLPHKCCKQTLDIIARFYIFTCIASKTTSLLGCQIEIFQDVLSAKFPILTLLWACTTNSTYKAVIFERKTLSFFFPLAGSVNQYGTRQAT